MLTTWHRPRHQTLPRLAGTCQLGVISFYSQWPLRQLVPRTALTPMVLQTALSAQLAPSTPTLIFLGSFIVEIVTRVQHKLAGTHVLQTQIAWA